jgi:hypothetical protein
MIAPRIELTIPEEFYNRLEDLIDRRVEAALQKNLAMINAKPVKLTRLEVCERLRITTPTLNKMEKDGRLIPERAGRRVLYDQRSIESFLQSSSRG